MGIWGIIFGLIFVGVGGFLAVFTLVDLRSAKRAAAWPQVQGKVRTSRVVERETRRGTSYSAEVKYEYEVDGIQHTSDRIKFEWQSTGYRSAEATAERYPAGSPMPVYYDPQEPSLSVLEREIEVGSVIFVILFGLLFVGFGIYMLSGLFGN